MKNTFDVAGGKPIANCLQFISGVSENIVYNIISSFMNKMNGKIVMTWTLAREFASI
jgi:hypothetical protein